MRNVNILVMLCAILYLGSCRQASNDSNGEVRRRTDTPVVNIRPTAAKVGIDTALYVMGVEKYVDSVDRNLSGLSLSKVDVFGESSEGGEIRVYSTKSDTVRLKALYYGETGKNEYTLYLRDKHLVAFMETSVYYNRSIGKKPVKVDSTISTTFVLYNGKVLNGKKGRSLINNKIYEEKSSDISSTYGEIKKQLRD